MKVAIIGSGNIGQALGGALVGAGHDVTLAARDAVETDTVAKAIGATTAATAPEALNGAQIVVLAVPYTALADVAAEIKNSVADKIVIDVTNPMGQAPAGTSAAQQLAEWLPGARVVKAFNTTFAGLLATPATHGQTLDALYATDDVDTGDVIAELIRSIGFRPVYAGGLNAAAQLEAMAGLNIQLQIATKGDWRSSFVLVGAPKGALEGLPKAA
ncbi:MAG: NADPH-dependent F420 reductase [Chloroflexota bacterium]|nr:NADPH-dependent F420 reductase [Chloroflexota bacterium]